MKIISIELMASLINFRSLVFYIAVRKLIDRIAKYIYGRLLRGWLWEIKRWPNVNPLAFLLPPYRRKSYLRIWAFILIILDYIEYSHYNNKPEKGTMFMFKRCTTEKIWLNSNEIKLLVDDSSRSLSGNYWELLFWQEKYASNHQIIYILSTKNAYLIKIIKKS